MSEPAPSVWIVATEETVARWLAPLAHLDATALAWGRTRAVDGAHDAVQTLRADPEALVLFTSRRGPEALPTSAGRRRRCVCVGQATEEAARDRGFEVVLVGRAGGADLAQRLLTELPAERRVLHVRGAEARPEAAEILVAGGVDVRSIVAYALEPSPAFTREVETLPEPALVVLGSPRAVEALHAALHEARRVLPEAVRFVAPGETTATAARAHWPARVHRAAQANPVSLAETVQKLIEEQR